MTIELRYWERLMNQARTKLTGASDSGIKAEAYEVLREFFQDSNSWREWISFTPVAGTQDYRLVVQEQGKIIRLNGVFDSNFFPQFCTLHDNDTDMLHVVYPLSSIYAPWTAQVVKDTDLPTSKDDIPIAPNWVLSRYSSHIIDGLLGKMMQQQNKPYSDKMTARYHLQRFRTGIQIARQEANAKYLVGAQTWRYPQQFRANGQRGGAVSTGYPIGGGPY